MSREDSVELGGHVAFGWSPLQVNRKPFRTPHTTIPSSEFRVPNSEFRIPSSYSCSADLIISGKKCARTVSRLLWPALRVPETREPPPWAALASTLSSSKP